MTRSDDVPRRVRRAESDVEAIYQLLGVVQGTLTRQEIRLDELAVVQNGHTATLAGHTATLAGHGVKLDRIIELLEQR